jgi:hypothetical protein
MKSEKDMQALGLDYLKQHKDAPFVLVAPDENVFLPGSENAARAYARENKFELLKVERTEKATTKGSDSEAGNASKGTSSEGGQKQTPAKSTSNKKAQAKSGEKGEPAKPADTTGTTTQAPIE